MKNHKRDYATDHRLMHLTALAVLIGALGVVAAWVLLATIRFFTNLFLFQTLSLAERSAADNTLGLWVIAVPVVGGLIVGLMARFGSDKIRGHGIPEAIEAILFGKSTMSPKVAVLKPLSSGIVIGSGGPFGAEGPIIMTGGSIGSLIAQHFHLSAGERKTLLVAGACAGMTAVFGTPLAAVILAVELLLFELRPRSLLPVAVACAVAGFLRALVLDSGPLFPMQTPPPGVSALVICVIAGLLSGALASGLSLALYKVEDLFGRLPLHWMWWPALGGVVVGIGGYLEPRALGVGYDVIADLLNHRMLLGAALALLVVKAIMWVAALGSGTSGGVLAPLLMMGAGLGLGLSHLFAGHDAALWPLVCMAATLAGVLGAPLTAAVFAFGLTHDAEALLPLLLACAVSYGFTVMTMKRSIMTEKIARRGLHIYREYGIDPLERHDIGEIMTRNVLTIDAALTAPEALMSHFGDAQAHRAFPVVDAGRYIGIVDRHYLMALSAEDAAPPLLNLVPRDQRADDVVLASDDCRSVAGQMAADGLERLAVVDDRESMRLIGIVSRSDLIKTSAGFFDDEMVRERVRGLPWSRRVRA